jgi:hypothetical protein
MCCRELLFGHGGELHLALDQHGPTSGDHGGRTGGPAPGKRVEYQRARGGVTADQLFEQGRRLGAGVGLRVPDAWDLKDVLLVPKHFIGRHDVRRPSAGRIGFVDRVPIKSLLVNAALGRVEGVGPAGGFTITVVLPRNPCFLDLGVHQGARRAGDNDGLKGRSRLRPVAGAPVREDPRAKTDDLETRIFKRACEPMTGAVVRDEDEPSSRLEDPEKEAQEI